MDRPAGLPGTNGGTSLLQCSVRGEEAFKVREFRWVLAELYFGQTGTGNYGESAVGVIIKLIQCYEYDALPRSLILSFVRWMNNSKTRKKNQVKSESDSHGENFVQESYQ